MSEFSFDRYLSAFDMLEEEVRRSTGVLVKKINPAAINLAGDELRAQSRTRRLRGLAVVGAMGCVQELIDLVIRLLNDTDHIVRSEAARVLGQCDARQRTRLCGARPKTAAAESARQRSEVWPIYNRAGGVLSIDPLRAISSLVDEATA